MNHPSSTSTLDSTLCHRSNRRSLPLSPCFAQLKRQSLSDFRCRFLLIKFQTPNKAYSSLARFPLPAHIHRQLHRPQLLSTTTTVPCRGFSCSTVPLLSLAGPKGLTRHHSPRPFNFPTGAQDLSCRNPTIPVATSPAGTFPVRSFKKHISSLRRLDDLLLATRACKAQLWCGKSLSLYFLGESSAFASGLEIPPNQKSQTARADEGRHGPVYFFHIFLGCLCLNFLAFVDSTIPTSCPRGTHAATPS